MMYPEQRRDEQVMKNKIEEHISIANRETTL
jgi:hypothetical protein